VVPSLGTRAHLLVVRAPTHDTTSLVAGKLRILEVMDTEVAAEVELRATDWGYIGRTRFRRTAPSCFGKAPWYVRLRGRGGCA
jgi:hypothetical protein